MTAELRLGDGPNRLFARFRAIILCAFLGLLVVALALVAASVRVKEAQDRRMITELLRGHAFLLDSQALSFRQAATAIGERLRSRLDALPGEARSELDHACSRQGRQARLAAGNSIVAADASGAITILSDAALSPADESELSELRAAVAAAAFSRSELKSIAPNLAALTVYAMDGDPILRVGQALAVGRNDDAIDCSDDVSRPIWVADPEPRTADAPDACGAGSLRFLAPVAATSGHSVRIALDLEPCAIRRMNADLPIEGGRAFLVANGDIVIGAPGLPASVARLENAVELDDAARRAAADPFAQPAGDLVAEGDRLTFVQPLTHAPWALVVSISAADLRNAAIFETSTRLGLLLALIAATLAVAVSLTRREFIAPAQALVADIVSRGAGLRPPNFDAPAGWKPYFAKIRDVFAENEEAAALRQELTIAARMQASILPTDFPAPEADLGVWGFARPAREVGGDFFDIFEIGDGRLGVVIADVSGKGVPAALFMVLTRTLTRAAAMEGAPPAEVVARVNRLLAADNPETMFVTMFYGVVDPAAGEMRFSNAGHNAPYRLRDGEAPTPIGAASGIALGVFDDAEYDEATVDLLPGDAVALFTDGVTEAMDDGDREYGEDRLEALLGRLGPIEPDALAAAIEADVDAFAGAAPQADDITLLTLKLRRAPALREQLRSPDEIAAFADRLSAWCESRGAGPEETHALSLSLDELISNTFEHGGADGEAPTADIHVREENGVLIATLEDDGSPFDPFSAAAPDLDAAAEDRSVGGLGVHFARILTDGRDYERRDGRNIVTLTKRLNHKEAT